MAKLCAFPGLIDPRLRAGALVVAFWALSGCGEKGPPPSPPTPEVSVIKLAPVPVTVFEEYVGQTEAIDTVEIRARVGGILERQAYTDGANVKKDDLLFVIDRQPFTTALEQAKANLNQAQASLENSNQNLTRAKPLLTDQAISQQDYDAAVAKQRSDAANVESLRAQVHQAELNLAYTSVRASRDGVVSKALIRPGGLVNASTTLLTTLYSVDPIHVNFTVGEQKLIELKQQWGNPSGKSTGDAAPFRLKLIDGSDYPQRGKLDFIDAAVDPKNGTLQVRIAVPNPEHALRPGQFVRVIVAARESANAVRVPQRAVTELLGTQSVFVVGSDGKASPRDIVAKTRVGNDWVVDKGLAPGELVVVDGISKVRPGAAVKAVLATQEGGQVAPAATTPPATPPATAPAQPKTGN
jgi:membrane fusion protein (multidrug efflux system)